MLHRAGPEAEERERAQKVFEQTLEVAKTQAHARGGAEGGRFVGFISVVALILSGVSLYETVLKQAHPVVHAGAVVSYARDAESVEVFAVPVTITNHGAREAIVTALDLRVKPAKAGLAAVPFASAYTGGGSNPVKDKQPFTPLSIPGRGSYAGTVLFYPANLKSRAPYVVTGGGETFRFCLGPRLDEEWSWWDVPVRWLDRLLGATPAATSFEAELPWFAARSLDASQAILLPIRNAKRHPMPRGGSAPDCD